METVSVASSESFADQGYAASEGMAEESGPVSPSERIQSVSPVDIMSLNSGSAMPAKQSKDSSSDSDEGCATWGSRKRYAHVHVYSSYRPPQQTKTLFTTTQKIWSEKYLNGCPVSS